MATAGTPTSTRAASATSPRSPARRARSLAVPSQDWNASHESFDGGRNDGFVRASGPVAMWYWDKHALPFSYSLARHFPIGQRYFCSVLAQTYPNRRFFFTGTASGTIARQGRPYSRRPPTARSSTASTRTRSTGGSTSRTRRAWRSCLVPLRPRGAPHGYTASTSSRATSPPAGCRSSPSSTRTTRRRPRRTRRTSRSAKSSSPRS